LKNYIRLVSILLLLAGAAAAQTVSISSPAAGATVGSPVQFTASASGGSYPMTAMRIYVDNNAMYTVNAASLNTSLSLGAGSHYVAVVAWNSAGQAFTKTENITVGSGGTGGVTISSPASGGTVTSPVNFVASATGGSYPITAMRVYVDNNSMYTVNAASLNTSLSLGAGSHYVVVVAWNSAGQAFTQAESINVGSSSALTASGGVSVSSPSNGATVSSPAHFVASASSNNTITAMRVYVDGNSAYTAYANSIDTYVSMSAGTHSVIVQAWDSTGAVFKTPLSLNVGSASSGNTTLYQNNFTNQSNWLMNWVMSDGAINSSGNQIEPYFSNIAAIGLVRDPSKYGVILGWMKWYINHLNYGDKWGLSGTMYVYNTDSSGNEINTYTADSTDSYAGTFLTLVWQAYKTGDPNLQAYIKTLYSQLDLIAQVLVQTQHANGLTWATPAYNIEYLMDNCEGYRGLRDVAQVFQYAFNDSNKAAYYNQRADMMYNGIMKMYLGNGQWSMFTDDIGTLQTPNMGVWYPDATAQIFPMLEGVLPGSDARSQATYNNFNAAWPGWPNLSFNSQDPFPWVLVADAAAAMGDTGRLNTYVNTVTNKYVNQGYPAPWNAEEAGFWLRVNSYLAGGSF
jgi:post-segregation antitoxin (ccd killing protein)